MHMLSTTQEKILLGTTGCIIFALLFILFAVPRSTQAVWGIGDLPVDTANLGPNVGSTISEGGSLGEQIADGLKEFGLDTASYMAGQAMQEQLVNKTLEWATSGFEGNPFYVEDQGSFMKEFEDVEILQMYSTIDEFDFQNSFSGSEFSDFSFSDKNTILGILEINKIPLEEQLTPTLSTDQLSNFSSDFKNGGWDAWDELAKPSNNAMGRKEIIENEYLKQVADAKEAAEQELAQNDGFQAKKECVDNSGGNAFGTDLSSYGFNVESSYFSANNDPNCERYTTETPGSVISNTTNTSTSAQFASLPQIDEISEIASSALGSMLIGLTNKGLSAISGGGGTSQSAELSGVQYLGVEIDNNTNSDGSVDWLSTPTQSVDLEVELPEAIRQSGLATAYLTETVNLQRDYLPIIMDLDYLLPGPDFGWAERLQDYFQDRSLPEQMFIARKSDINETREDNYDELKRQFVAAMQRAQENLEDVRLRILPIDLDIAVQGYVNNVSDFGREAAKAKDDLIRTRNLHLRLVAIKESIITAMGQNISDYSTGAYDGNTGSWTGDTWMDGAEWAAWRNVGVIDGVPQTNADGTPNDDVRAREELRQLFLGMNREIPKESSLTRFRNTLSSTEFNVKDMKRLLREVEQFWADNYRITETGEDYSYWNSLYSWFENYTTGANLGTTDLGVVRGQTDNDGHSTYRPIWDRPESNGNHGGPWSWDGWSLPSNWPDIYPGFQTNNILESYLDTTLGVVGKLRQIERNTNTGAGNPRRFYSIPVSISPNDTLLNMTGSWNGLLRDREKRLYCGFQIWERNKLSNVDGFGKSKNKRYERIWCSESWNGEEAAGGDWYRASSFDYSKVYRPDLAGVLLGL